MNEQKQRIAIAEACGWSHNGSSGNEEHPWVSPLNGIKKHLPDYLNDLNAIHEAFALRNNMEQLMIVSKLVKSKPNSSPKMAVAYSVAADWCEAFLKTIGKWEVDDV